MARQTRAPEADSTNTQGGFTIVELMIATLVFSVVLLLCATAVIQVGRVYYKGVITNRTEDVSRKVINDVSQSIQFGSIKSTDPQVVPDTTPSVRTARCIGTTRYTYTPREVMLSDTNLAGVSSKHVLWKDRIGQTEACVPVNLNLDQPSTGRGGQELLAEKMRLTRFDAAPRAGTTGLWDINITIAYGESDVFVPDGTYSMCTGIRVGGQFCSISILNTTVGKRL